MIEHVADSFEGGQRFLVTSHLNPDGDAVGSMLAVVHLLRGNGKEAFAFHSDTIPSPYRFLAGTDEVVTEAAQLTGVFDTLVVVDVGERERIPATLPAGTDAARVVVIDHHQHHGDLGEVVWRRSASSVGEMIVELARFLGWEMTLECAECAYTAILSDTGSFRYSSTTAACLELASYLVAIGVQPWKVASYVFESWPPQRMQLLGEVLRTLDFGCQGRLASLVISQDLLTSHQASSDLTEGFVNQGRMIEGVEVSVLYRERQPNQYRLSFRSRGRVDVGEIALQLGGGGHRNAAGASVTGTVKELQNQVSQLVSEALERLDPEDPDGWSRR